MALMHRFVEVDFVGVEVDFAAHMCFNIKAMNRVIFDISVHIVHHGESKKNYQD